MELGLPSGSAEIIYQPPSYAGISHFHHGNDLATQRRQKNKNCCSPEIESALFTPDVVKRGDLLLLMAEKSFAAFHGEGAIR